MLGFDQPLVVRSRFSPPKTSVSNTDPSGAVPGTKFVFSLFWPDGISLNDFFEKADRGNNSRGLL